MMFILLQDKIKLLKKAKEEAKEEILKMKNEEETKFKKKEEDTLNSLEEKEINNQINKELDEMKKRVEKQGDIVAANLVNQIKNISLQLPRNYQMQGV